MQRAMREVVMRGTPGLGMRRTLRGGLGQRRERRDEVGDG